MTRALLVLMLVTVLAPRAGAQSTGFQIGGVAFASTRSTVLDGTSASASAMLPGVDLLLRLKLVGITARLTGAEFPAGASFGALELGLAEAGLLLGPRVLAVEGTYRKRVFRGTLGVQDYAYSGVGARSMIPIGGTGVTAMARGSLYLDFPKNANAPVSGGDAEASLRYSLPRIPLYVLLGYRIEQFTLAAGPGERWERLTGWLVGAGLRLGR